MSEANNLSDMTTLKVGGPARTFIRAKTEEELISAVKAADEKGEKLLILGGGSNVLIADAGFEGTVIHVETSGNSYEIDACSGGTLQVAAGVDWDEFVAFTLEKGLANLECLSGIPGTIGGAPIQNIGAYGHEVSESIARVRTYDRLSEAIKTFTSEECDFSYRSSIFKKAPDRYVILDVTFNLRLGEDSLAVGYQELADALNVNVGDRAPIESVRAKVLELRAKKGMLTGMNINSAGSFFTNPIVSRVVADSLPADAPRWPQPDGSVKTSAAWLMEHAGVHKGDTHLGASISAKHVLALTNTGTATAEDIAELARSAQKKVKEVFGITLEAEVQFVGVKL